MKMTYRIEHSSPAPGRMDQPSDMRIGDDGRAAAAELLGVHYAAGRLSTAELETRLAGAWSAVTAGDLEPLLRDLPEVRPRSSRARGARIAVRIHTVAYVLVTVLLVAIWFVTPGAYFWPIWPALGWGFGLAAHAAVTAICVSSGAEHPHRS